jgi:NTE family protein
MVSESDRTPKSTYDQCALVLQGGGALGAYQAGVYEALANRECTPNWFAGISIGSINAAIIAGNEPSQRVVQLRKFWDEVTSSFFMPAPHFEEAHTVFNLGIAGLVTLNGVPGFFEPRLPPALFYPRGSPQALSVYDSAPLRSTLERLVDFDRINSGECRLSIGAVNIETGNFAYFDNTKQKIGPEHVMASGALPPGLPPIEIEGKFYWDGGLVSNTPLMAVLDGAPKKDTLIFQIDLFGARGEMPRDLFEVDERRKDIVYSSRTRMNTDVFKETYALRRAIRELHDLLPEDHRALPQVKDWRALGEGHRVAIVHLIYRRRPYEGEAMDYEFSRASMQDHWKAGFDDATITLNNPRWNEPALNDDSINVFDLTRDQD